VLDLFPPNADDYHDEPGITQYLPIQRRGETLLRVKDYRFDRTAGRAISDVRYYGYRSGHDEHARVVAQFRYSLRLDEPERVRALLGGAGYRVEETYGTYDRAPLTTDSPRAIFVATLNAATPSPDLDAPVAPV
jgi:hypothetical protein